MSAPKRSDPPARRRDAPDGAGGLTSAPARSRPRRRATDAPGGTRAAAVVEKRKVVLYNPVAVFYTLPLALVAVGSALDRERFEVVIVDGRLEDDPVAAVLAHLDGAVCLGVSVLTGAPIRDALRVSRAAKRARPDLPVVWGGWHPSLFPVEILAEPAVDVSVQGQGERTFAELVDHLADGRPLDDVNGIAWRRSDAAGEGTTGSGATGEGATGEGATGEGATGEGRAGMHRAGEPVRNPPRALLDMDALPAHDYALLDVERYFALKGKRQLDYVSSTGCAFRCAFCADPFVYKRRWVAVSPTRVGAEVETLWRRHRFTELAFQDETFFTYRDRVAAIAEEFLRRGLDLAWTATLRADQAVRLGDEHFAHAVRSGLRRVMVGVESGSQEMLDWMSKDVTVDQVVLTAELCVRHRVGAIFPFIVGFPGETDASVRASLALIKKLRAMSPDFDTPLFYFKPYPGSPITDEVVKNGYRLPATLDEWADFDFIGSAGTWVSPEKRRLIERFKFYNRFAGGPERWFKWPLQTLSRWRCRRDDYRLPIEKLLVERLYPEPRLS